MHFVRHWHARVGVITALLFLLLALSGMALNHTDALNLARHQIHADWLMRWYGLKPDVPTRGYLFKEGYIAASAERWVMDGRVLLEQRPDEVKQNLVGAITWGDMRAIVSEHHLLLYLPDGTLVDHLTGEALPNTPIKRVGSVDESGVSQLVLETTQGSFVTADGLAWRVLKLTKPGPLWANEQLLPNALSAGLSQAFSPSLSLERIVLDLHSGRIFGRYGTWLMDVAAIVLIILSVSGIWIYLRTVRKPKRR